MHWALNDLIVPLTAFISAAGSTGFLLYLRIKEIAIVRLLIWIVWTTLLFGGVGLGSASIPVLPYSFATAAMLSVLLGVLYVIMAPITLPWWRRSVFMDVALHGFIFLCFGVLGFSIVYNIAAISGVSVNYFLVALSGFTVPLLFLKSYDYWMSVPPKKYNTWIYPVHQAIPQLQPVDPIKLVMNFTPVPSGKDGSFESYEVEFPSNISLSELFHYFISFHNRHREYRKKPIQFMVGEKPVEWVLYKYAAGKKRIYLDMEKTLLENRIMPNEAIYAWSLNRE